jgi:peptidoglycan hydrolase-like protein with peptidoglycan-binding domain
MQIIRGGLRLSNKQRHRAWYTPARALWMLAASMLALAFPATAMGAGTDSGHPNLTANRAIGGSPSAADARLGGPLLTLGSGYGSPGGSPLVRAVQGRLQAVGYPTGVLDGRYGPRTQQAVLAFQAAHGLQADGVVGPQTWAALSTPAVILGPGAGAQAGGSNIVRSLQRRLAAAGDLPGPIDGRYGPLTEAAVRRFQRAHGLTANGMAGPRTLALLARPLRSARRSAPLPQRPAPTLPLPSTRSQHPRSGSGHHRPGSATVPWMSVLGGLALVLALIIAAPLVVAALPRARRRRDGQPSAATMACGDSESPAPAVSAAANGSGNGVAPHGNGVAPHGNGVAPLESGDASESVEAAGAFNLGLLLEAQGSAVDAQAAYGRADERGHGPAASNLGRLLEEQGAVSEAEAAYRRADERGDPGGAFNLGVLLEERSALDEAEAAYRRAIDRGYDAAASNLGVLLEEQGALSEAEAAYRHADERGDATAAFNLGVLLEERGAFDEAEEAYRRAEQRGDGDIANMAQAALLDLGPEVQGAGAVGAGQLHDA